LQHTHSSLEGVKYFVILKFSLVQSYIREDSRGCCCYVLGWGELERAILCFLQEWSKHKSVLFSLCRELNNKEVLSFMFVWTMGSRTFIMEYIKYTRLFRNTYGDEMKMWLTCLLHRRSVEQCEWGTVAAKSRSCLECWSL